ncbi:peptidase MA family protein [Leptospira idonii]|uniref:Peptidase MA family protein n=1 Tax=Leptospira idonii TaxID=1193500 RepID=A0A4R9LYK3_9LEPT|nr:peptidase MA family protein [Leptospira idonii]TGN17671.1 peptidase MA family protein [Leptospira idonii]
MTGIKIKPETYLISPNGKFMFSKNQTRFFLFCFSLLFVSSSFSLFSQEAKPKAVYSDPSRKIETKRYDFGSTAPREYDQLSSLEEPNLKDLRLKFNAQIPGYYTGPDGGEVYIFKPNQYQWKRKDGSTFFEFEGGNWRLELSNGSSFISYTLNCSGCLPKLHWRWGDGTQIWKEWIPHRKDFEWVFQKTTPPLLNWQIVDPSKRGFQKSNVSIYELYHSPNWNLFVKGLKENFKDKEFFEFVRREFNLENRGKVPVLMFASNAEITTYEGKKLVGGSEEGGFGSQNAITLCCGNKQFQETDSSVLNEDAKRRGRYETFYHEATHNLTQITCTSYKAEADKLSLPVTIDHWFEEGFANYVAGQFSPREKNYIYTELDKRIKEGKIPRTFKTLVDQGYKDMIPYTLGAYMVEYMHSRYGGRAVTEYHKNTCLGMDLSSALEKTTGMNPDQFIKTVVSDFQTKMQSLKQKDMKKSSMQGFTVMMPKNRREYDAFVSREYTVPSSIADIRNYDDVPNLQKIFQANVEDYSKLREGEFDAPGNAIFFLFKNGLYKWFTSTWEVGVFPGDQIVLQKDGWQFIEWEDGTKKAMSPDGTSVMFWSREQKGYFDKSGKKIDL